MRCIKLSFLVTIISFIIVFGVLVTVHEYGHMFFAKRAGIMCPEFAIGMGPKIFSFRKNETLYTIRLLPVGGYVRMAGDGLEEPPVQPGMHVKIKLNGVGVTILPEIMMKHLDREQFEFQRVNIDEKPLIRSTFLSYDASMKQLPQVESFINLMMEYVES